MSHTEPVTNENNFECPVCFENIGNKNSCVTSCGHKFCLNCLLQSYNSLNNCPLCRETLNVNEKPDEEDEDEDDYDEEDDDYEDDDDSVTLEDSENEDDEELSVSTTEQTTDITKLATVENITDELKTHGFTMEDLVSLYLERPLMKDILSNTVDGKIMQFEVDMKYQISKALLDKIIDVLDYNAKREYDENALMTMEDTSSAELCINLLSHLPFSMDMDIGDIDIVV